MFCPQTWTDYYEDGEKEYEWDSHHDALCSLKELALIWSTKVPSIEQSREQEEQT